MAFISITRLRLRSWAFLPMFLWKATASIRQARQSEGYIELKLLRDAHGAFWTASLWKDGAAMRAYMLSGAHGEAMKSFIKWCDEGAVAHWDQNEEALPDWSVSHARLETLGRPSKVRHPSKNHMQGIIPFPRIGKGRELG